MQMHQVPNVRSSSDHPRGGISLHFELSGQMDLQQSALWSAGGRRLQFFCLGSNQQLTLPSGEHFIKVVLGQLVQPDRQCWAAPFAVRSTKLGTNQIIAGSSGALFALMTLDDRASERVRHISELEFTGEGAHQLQWQTFEEKFDGALEFFNGKDCYMADGFHLLDMDGREIVYVNPWACGKGVDLSTHNHAHAPSELAPAFAEVHWVLAAATPTSGMYQKHSPEDDRPIRHPMVVGDEHGPYFDRQPDGRPVMRSNGAVQYPWHGWQGGDDGDSAPAYDFVAAFEINPAFVQVS